jgi:hypothetical protein
MNRQLRVVASALALTFAYLGAGCASISAFRKERLRQEGAGAYAYPRPIEQVWPEVEGFLKEKGFSFRPAERYTLVTDPLETSPGSGQWITVLVQGKAVDPGRTIIRVFKKTRGGASIGGSQPSGGVSDSSIVTAKQTEGRQTTGGGAPAAATAGLTRYIELEWDLLQKIDPQGADQISAEADRIAEGKAGGMDVAQAQRAREQAVTGSASKPSGPVSLEDALEAEREKKRLVPAVWIPATAGAVLVGSGLAFEFSARQQEGRLIDGDVGIQSDEDIRKVRAIGQRNDIIGMTMITAGALSLGAAMVIHYTGIAKPKTPAVSIVPTAGGAAAVVGGSF